MAESRIFQQLLKRFLHPGEYIVPDSAGEIQFYRFEIEGFFRGRDYQGPILQSA